MRHHVIWFDEHDRGCLHSCESLENALAYAEDIGDLPYAVIYDDGGIHRVHRMELLGNGDWHPVHVLKARYA